MKEQDCQLKMNSPFYYREGREKNRNLPGGRSEQLKEARLLLFLLLFLSDRDIVKVFCFLILREE